ncbi:MAG: hypothetical protein LBM59_02575 [Ruminococcus sp.]|jgi:hypothetical protein|nr:hypothetical protein [Ruminococcus sp.]
MKKFYSLLITAIIVLSFSSVTAGAAFYDEQTFWVSGVTAAVNKDGSVTTGVNFMGTVDSASTVEAVKAAAVRADIVKMDVIIIYVPKGTVGISKSGVEKICEAAGGKYIKLCFLISDDIRDRKVIDLRADSGQIIAENL